MNQGEHQIGFEHLGIGSVLKRHKLQVPSHQREYSWTESQVKRLFHDFASAIAKGEKAYFLGTVVTIPRGLAQLEVIDGQQRLATTAILLFAIKAYLASIEAVMAASLNEFLSDYSDDRRSTVPRLKLNTDDNQHFCSMMNSEPSQPTRPSHHLLNDAFQEANHYVQQIVSAHDKKSHGDVLNQWITFIEHYAHVVLLKVPDPTNAFKMFETLNDRGLRTSQSDLIKNYLFGEAGDRLIEAQNKWGNMRAILSTMDTEEDLTLTFIRVAMIVLSGYLTEAELFERVQHSAKGPPAAIRFLDSLEKLAVDYVAMFNATHEKWNTYDAVVRKAIGTLNMLGVKPMRPLMLAVASKFEPKETRSAYSAMVCWAVRLLIASSTRSGSVEQPLANSAREVWNESVKTAAKLRAELARIVPADTNFESAFAVARSSQPRFARYYLRSIEESLRGNAEPCFIVNDDQQVINLEHIMPLKPDVSWDIDTETHANYVRRLGNMTLMQASANAGIGSADYGTKQQAYMQSQFKITSSITAKLWDAEAIEERQKGMAKQAVLTWPL